MNPMIRVTSVLEFELTDEFETEEEMLNYVLHSVGESWINMNQGKIQVEFPSGHENTMYNVLRTIEKFYGMEDGELDMFANMQEFPYVVSMMDENNNPEDNLDSFVHLQDAIDYAKGYPGSGVFFENYREDKEICEYRLLWHPCGDCAEYPDCKKDMFSCEYSEACKGGKNV